ncbi:MAG: hypothetical protein WCW87_03255 [Candidatus Paceibacterota bacterium]
MLTPKEEKILSELINKIEFPIGIDIFYAWAQNFYQNAVEFIILREGVDEKEIFLIWRDDKYYKCFHIPGTIIRPKETQKIALKRLVKDEINNAKLSTPKYLKFIEFMKGDKEGELARGQVCSFIYVANTKDDLKIIDGKFFPISKIPDNTLSAHKIIIDYIKKEIDKKNI